MKLLAVDLFSGAGGLSLGFAEAGFEIAVAIEANRNAAFTFQHNHPSALVINANIETLSATELMKESRIKPGQADVLLAGLPCQGFSESNRLTRNLDNKRNLLYRHFFRFLKAFRPKYFVIENVAGMKTLLGGKVIERIMNLARMAGYKADWRELNAAEFGVPQFRRRVFIMGTRLNNGIEFPEVTHGACLKPFVSVHEAISDLPILENGAMLNYGAYKSKKPLSDYQREMRARNGRNVQGHLVTRNSDLVLRRYSFIKEGHNWESIPKRLMRNYSTTVDCHTGIYYRLRNDCPSKVIGNFRKNMLIHPEQHRGLSIREAARIQSFPDHYEFIGSIGFQQQQVADAVPPLLAKAVALKIKRSTVPFGLGRSSKNGK